MSDIDVIIKDIQRIIVPSDDEVRRIQLTAENYRSKVFDIFKDYVEDDDVFIGGSVARGTFIRDEYDIDIFIRFPKEYDINFIKDLLFKRLQDIFPKDRIRRRYAEHPYAEIIMDKFNLNVVPAFKTEYPNWLSPVDRSYFHNLYLIKRIDRFRIDAVLAKSLFKGIGVYGAEASVGGLSGYLTELLILYYNGFKNLLNAISSWTPPVILDPESHYKSLEDIKKVFEGADLIVVDPIDKGRNVAAALTKRKFSMLISGVKAFLSRPRKEFFHIYRVTRVKEEQYNLDEIINRQPVIVVDMRHGEKIEDIHYPQLYSLARKLVRQLENNGFKVYKYMVYSNYKDRSIVALLLERDAQHIFKMYVGPYPYFAGETDFLVKNRRFVRWIGHDGRWYVLKPPKYVNAYDLLETALLKGLIKVPEGLYNSFNIYRVTSDTIKHDSLLSRWIKEFIIGDEYWKDLI